MLHTIQNKNLICKIDSNGAEIRSLINKATGQEYIWQIDQSIWGSSSPVLFPAIGKIKSGKIEYKGKAYEMPKHGIIRNNDQLKFQQKSKSQCSFTLESSEVTLGKYPFKFLFEVDYELVDNRLIMTYTIYNRDEVEMNFSCGGHTAYATPLVGKTNLSDYVIEFPRAIKLKAETLGDSGLLSYQIRDITTEKNLLPLSEILFNEDALIFSNIDFDWVRLRKRTSKEGIIVKFSGYPHLALWSKPGADYVCIEPWLGLPDREEESIDITKKSTYKSITPGDLFSIAIETIVE